MVMEELQELLQIIFYLKIVQIQNLSYTQFQLQLKRVAFCDIFYHIDNKMVTFFSHFFLIFTKKSYYLN